MSVYFAEAGGYMKIGYSKNPFNRVGSITRNGKRPDDLPFGARASLLGWIPGDLWHESAVQAKYIDVRVAGEWFRIDRDEIRTLLWADPRGVDLQGMSNEAVSACFNHPELTRAEIQSTGVRIIGYSATEQQAKWESFFGPTVLGGAA